MTILIFILHVKYISEFLSNITKPLSFKGGSIIDKYFELSYECIILSEVYFNNSFSKCYYHFRLDFCCKKQIWQASAFFFFNPI